MPPPYENATSSSSPTLVSGKSTAIVVSPPSPQPSMSSLWARRSAALRSALVTPPPYCASPPLVPIPVLRGTADSAAGEEDGDDERGSEDEGYLALSTPAQRSYFVTLSDMFEAAAEAAGAGSPGASGKGEKARLPQRPIVAAGQEPEAGCFSACVVS
ncbi:hypothetical protein JCM3770_000193 [Rhodotorula araucariae]